MAAVAGRYGAGDTLVAHATKAADPQSGTIRIDVSTTRYGASAAGQTVVRTYTSGAGETLDALLRRAAAEIAVDVEDDWKRDKPLPVRQPRGHRRDDSDRRAREWLAIRDRLAGMAVIRSTDVVLLSRTEVRVNLHTSVTTEQLVLALAQADLALSQDAAGWVLRSQRKDHSGLSLPNFISLGRLLAVPLAVWLILTESSASPSGVLAAGISDAVDGFLAKRLNAQTELGKVLDPLADKALLVGVYVTLARPGICRPGWSSSGLPDLLIVGGIILSHTMSRPVRMRPLKISKLNTAAQIVLAGGILGGWAWICGLTCWSCRWSIWSPRRRRFPAAPT
jgi:cardiolipin synthase